MGDPTSSYATAGIALRVSGALKPHHHDKVETSSVGLYIVILITIFVLLSAEQGLFSRYSDQTMGWTTEELGFGSLLCDVQIGSYLMDTGEFTKEESAWGVNIFACLLPR
jgi:hypothetical protein